MNLEELKKYTDGVCLGYSSIDYLKKNVYPYTAIDETGYFPSKRYKDFAESKVYPIILYYKNSDGKEGILCRPMVYKDNLLKSTGLFYRIIKQDGRPSKIERICYVAKTVLLPIDTVIDSIYEVMREQIAV